MGAGERLASLFIAPLIVAQSVALASGTVLSTGSTVLAGTTIAFGTGAIGKACVDIATQL